MYVVKLLFLILILHYGQGRDLGSVDLPEVTGFILEKGKPIQLQKSYESVQIAGLKGILYSDSLSKLDGVKVLRIKEHSLTAIEKGALCSAPNLKELEVDFYDSTHNLTHLTKEMFANCNHLEELLLKFPYEEILYEIDQNAFEDLTNLKKFVIQSYKIRHLKKNIFVLPHSLQEIVLASAEIEEVDSDAFENLNDLEKIGVLYNRNWSYLPKNLFKNFPKLKTIRLRDNGLKDLTWDEFEGLSSIEELDVAFNKISSFDAEKIAKFLPNLKRISLEENSVRCKQMEAFVKELQEKLGHFLEATYKFDAGFYDPCKYGDEINELLFT